MQYKLKKVLSILAVFVVLIGSLFVPVHAQGNEDHESSSDTDAVIQSELKAKTESSLTPDKQAEADRIDGEGINDISSGVRSQVFIVGDLKRNDDVYAIRLVDTYKGTYSEPYFRYKTKKWVLDLFEDGYDPIFNSKDGNVDIKYEDLKKISAKADTMYNPISEAVDKKHVFKVNNPSGNSVRKDDLPYGLYLIKVVVPDNDNRSFGPAILGVNPDTYEEESIEYIQNETLNLGREYKDKATGEVHLKGEKLPIRKSFVLPGSSQNEKIYTSNYCPAYGEKVTFLIENIYIPNYAINQFDDDEFDDKFIFLIEDTFKNKGFIIDGDIKVLIDHDHDKGKADTGWVTLEKKDLKDYQMYDKSDHGYVYVNETEGFIIPFNPLASKQYDYVKSKYRYCFGKFMSIKYTAKFNGKTGENIDLDKELPSTNYLKAYENKVTATITQEDNKKLEETATATAWTGTIPFLKYDRDLYVKNGSKSFENTGLGGAKFITKKTVKELCDASSTTKADAKSGENGIVSIKGVSIDFKDSLDSLDDFDTSISSGPGITYFMEIEAPDGYVRSANRYKIMTNGYKADGESLKFVMHVYNLDNLEKRVARITDKDMIDPLLGFWQIPNSMHAYLPSSGSNTMMILTVIGIVLITGAVVISRKKKHQDSNN